MDRLSLLVRAKISIHASAKEATSLHMLIHLSYLDFNPRLREGGDFAVLLPLRCPIIFQSTPPRRRRRLENQSEQIELYFNPRLREGGDTEKIRRYLHLMISIHASAKEATNLKIGTDGKFEFQSTPPRRRRQYVSPVEKHGLLISIHASAKEATYIFDAKWNPAKFQSTPPRRRRLIPDEYMTCTVSFQSTPPRRRRLVC